LYALEQRNIPLFEGISNIRNLALEMQKNVPDSG
jgi:hypothetical protein